jgi:hypothetical protein
MYVGKQEFNFLYGKWVGKETRMNIKGLPLPTTCIDFEFLLTHIHPDWTRRRNQYGFRNVVNEY